MLEQYIRPYYQRLFVDGIANKIAHKITPNQVTSLACLIGLFVLPALIFHHFILAVLLLLTSGYCDTLDGTLARTMQASTPLGTVLDIFFDRIVEFAVILGLFFVQQETRAFMCIIMLGSILLCVTSFLLVGLFTSNNTQKNFYYSPGIIERPEAFIFFILMILLPTSFTTLAAIFVILVFITTMIRLYQFSLSQFKISAQT